MSTKTQQATVDWYGFESEGWNLSHDRIFKRDEVKEMNTNCNKLEADVSIVKTVNNILMKKSVDIERQCWANA